MRKRIPNGRTAAIDLALAIHKILDLPLDPITERPKFGLQIVRAIQKAMTDALNRGEDVYINGFGKFKVKSRKSWNVPKPAEYNPGIFGHEHSTYSDEPLVVKAKKRVYFKPSIQLTAMLNVDNPNVHEKTKAIDKW